ncbi:hypothetical protein G6699_01955 [Polynucleobacter paneuropaeus]|nr:hypothetical protein [Polynucleobacter paneuropaeus]
MLKLLALTGALIIATTNLAVAGGATAENYFDGVYGQVELGMGSITNSLIIANSGGAETFPFGYTAPMYAFTLGYSKEILDLEGIHDINFAANISYNGTNGNSGSLTASGDGGATDYLTMNTKNIWTLSLEPGYYLAEQAIVYAKLGYGQAQTSITSTLGFTANFGTQSGPLFGFGFKHALDALGPNLFWGLEAYQLNLMSKSISDQYGNTFTSKPTILFGKVHLGYVF